MQLASCPKVSPGASAADHSVNTLRYADRTKDHGGSNKKSPIRTHSPKRSNASVVASNASTVSIGGTTTGKPTTPIRSKAPKPSIVADEEALRETVRVLVEQEENILKTHMSNIQENAELLTLEGALLAEVQLPGRTSEDIERYACTLEEILEHKEDMITSLRNQMKLLKDQLQKEHDLSEKVGSLA